MIPDLSVLRLASAVARHAGEVHRIAGDNIARADIPKATAATAPRFADALAALNGGQPLAAVETNAPIALDREMATMASNAGRHQTATAVWSKTLELFRLAGASPR